MKSNLVTRILVVEVKVVIVEDKNHIYLCLFTFLLLDKNKNKFGPLLILDVFFPLLLLFILGPKELGKYKTLVARQLKQAYLSSGTIFVVLICYPVFLDEACSFCRQHISALDLITLPFFVCSFF